MITHTEASAKFKRCRNEKRGYKLANNTYLKKRGNAFAVLLYETNIVTIRPNGTYRLDTDGHRTVTTQKRMNMILPCTVSQTKGIWHIGDNLYTDNMLIKPDGKVVEGKPVGDILKIKAEVDRRVNKFIKLLVQWCSGCDLGNWESYVRKYALPCPANKIHLSKLWQTIVEETNYQTHYGLNSPTHLFKWVYLAILARGYKDPSIVWRITRHECMEGCKTALGLSDLRPFMRPSKPLIAEMIANGGLSR